jgi:hypothetical protein
VTLFPRSVRALEADRFRSSSLGMLVCLLILAAWIAWFFLARVAEYKVAGTARLERRPCVIDCGPGLPSSVQAVADFPASIALAHIRPGQLAYLHLDGLPRALFSGIRAQVTTIGTEVHEGMIRVEFTAQPDSDLGVALRPDLTATVEVEVDRVSPAELVMRKARRMVSLESAPAQERQP